MAHDHPIKTAPVLENFTNMVTWLWNQKTRSMAAKIETAQFVVLVATIAAAAIFKAITPASPPRLPQQEPFKATFDLDFSVKRHEKLKIKELLYDSILLEDQTKHFGLYQTWAIRDNKKMLRVSERGKCVGTFSYNDAIGNGIPVNRDIWDTRPKICDKEYANIDYSTMPSVSVVIPFHNEQLSTLLRTLHSVLLRSPEAVLKEIILVDDASTEDLHCIKEELEKAIFTLPKVKLIRLVQREGSTKARIYGAAYAVGDIISYLDSHVEVNRGWMDPIITRIKQDRHVVVMSLLDSIGSDDFSLSGTFIGYHGGFNWNLDFYWKDLPEYRKKLRTKESDPMPSPIMPAGAFAMDRSFFKEIGLLDADMKIWGVDDVELSFRIWQCGGRAEIMPCSRVGHIFRKRIPYTFNFSKESPNDPGKVVYHNAVRAAEVTLGKYKQFFYAQATHRQIYVNKTSILERLQFKQRAGCRSFEWFMENVIPEMPLPPEDAEYYEWVVYQDTDTCLTFTENKFKISSCTRLNMEQFFYINKASQFIHLQSKQCINILGGELVVDRCDPSTSTSWWYDRARQQISSEAHECLATANDGTVEVKACDLSEEDTWTFTYHFDWSKQLSYL